MNIENEIKDMASAVQALRSKGGNDWFQRPPVPNLSRGVDVNRLGLSLLQIADVSSPASDPRWDGAFQQELTSLLTVSKTSQGLRRGNQARREGPRRNSHP